MDWISNATTWTGNDRNSIFRLGNGEWDIENGSYDSEWEGGNVEAILSDPDVKR